MMILLVRCRSGWIVDGALHAEFLHCLRRQSTRGGDTDGNQHGRCQTYWTHGLLLTCDAPVAMRVVRCVLLSASLGVLANSFVHGSPALIHPRPMFVRNESERGVLESNQRSALHFAQPI